MHAKRLKALAKNLYSATRRNEIGLVKEILNNNDDNMEFVNIKGQAFKDGVINTPLHVASSSGYIDILKLLVRKAKANPDVKDSQGHTPSYLAAYEGRFEVLKILVEEANSDINIRNGQYGGTVIMGAIIKNRTSIVKYLAPRVKNINERNYYGLSSLYGAAQNANLDMVKDLVLVGNADVNLKNGPFEYTVLMKAIYHEALNIVEFLIEEGGADPHIKNEKGQDALFLAASMGNTAIVRYLVTHAKVNVNRKDNAGSTSLYVAAKKGFLKIVKILVEHTDVYINSRNSKEHDLPLGIAADKGHSDLVVYLLNNGAQSEVNYLNLKGLSALYRAVDNNEVDVVRVLVEIGKADVELRNEDRRWTALHIAAFEGYLDMVKFLVEEAGANVTARTGDERDTAESLAENYGYQDVAQYLNSRAVNGTERQTNGD